MNNIFGLSLVVKNGGRQADMNVVGLFPNMECCILGFISQLECFTNTNLEERDISSSICRLRVYPSQTRLQGWLYYRLLGIWTRPALGTCIYLSWS